MAPISSLKDVMVSRPYPGRGCILASVEGERVMVYFLTGRSEASRNRRLLIRGSNVVVADRDGSGHDPLRHYCAAVVEGGWMVVGNGDHVEVMASSLASGIGFVESMATLEAEPDPPIWTPRIWAAVQPGLPEQPITAGVVHRRDDGGTTRAAWSIADLSEDVGLLVTTYAGTPDSVVIADAPVKVAHQAHSPTELLDAIWDALDPGLRVDAAVVRPDADDTFTLVAS
ncbi:MAG TPA: IMP cyclohydrolase [Acidimicrobiales bacterium]|nr:IMP cyclohydrolase [Acidimicrobiales bacterium]